MKKILYIKANPKDRAHSYTFKLSDYFIELLKQKDSKIDIIELDLYKEEIPHLTAADLNRMFSHGENRIKTIAKQFAAADGYIIAAPLWNLSVPSILKAYIDHIMYAGITFKYTEQGPVGLMTGRKGIYIGARGGIYSTPPMSDYELGERYIKTIFGFMGIESTDSIVLEGTGMLPDDQITEKFEKLLQTVPDMVDQFRQ